MAMNPFDAQTITLAFPGLTMGAMPAASGGASARLDAETQSQVEAAQASGPYGMAHSMAYDDVIDPRELRNALLSALELASAR
jgi:acetyl-CoA carboxylase carboxyltransferase component